MILLIFCLQTATQYRLYDNKKKTDVGCVVVYNKELWIKFNEDRRFTRFEVVFEENYYQRATIYYIKNDLARGYIYIKKDRHTLVIDLLIDKNHYNKSFYLKNTF